MTPNPKSGFLEWMSPRGVITTGEYIFRVLVLIVLLFVPMLALGAFSDLVDPSNTAVQNIFAALITGSMLLWPFAMWGLLANTIKHYRTRGVVAPVFLALLTPILPIMFFFTWLFSSKEIRERNEALAQTQRTLRRNRSTEIPADKAYQPNTRHAQRLVRQEPSRTPPPKPQYRPTIQRMR